MRKHNSHPAQLAYRAASAAYVAAVEAQRLVERPRDAALFAHLDTLGEDPDPEVESAATAAFLSAYRAEDPARAARIDACAAEWTRTFEALRAAEVELIAWMRPLLEVEAKDPRSLEAVRFLCERAAHPHQHPIERKRVVALAVAMVA